MITKGTKAIMLKDGDEVLDVDGRMTVADIRMVMAGIITYTATKTKDGSTSKRWAYMDSIFNKVIEG
jgi:hypothetical protein